MGVTVNHALMRRVERDLVQERDRMIGSARVALRQAARVGVRATQARLLEATTFTGEARAAMAGGQPGRFVTGALYSDLGFYGGSEDEGAWFGWTPDQPSFDYAAAQDAGRYGATFVDDERGPIGGRAASPRIPPAGALHEGAIAAREEFKALMLAAGFKIRRGER